MATIYGTLGFTPGKILTSLRGRSDVESCTVFHDEHDQSRKARRELASYCSELGIAFESHEVDAFDIIACATAIQRALRSRPDEVVFNIAGGTKVLSSGAVLACILEGVPAVSVDERTGLEVALPLVEVPYRRLLGDQQRRVLSHIADHPGCTQTELREALGVSKPTISHHVAKLAGQGLVQESRDPDDGRRKRLDIIPSARLLIDEAAE